MQVWQWAAARLLSSHRHGFTAKKHVKKKKCKAKCDNSLVVYTFCDFELGTYQIQNDAVQSGTVYIGLYWCVWHC